MNINDENLEPESEHIGDDEIISLLPSKQAYFIAYFTLFFSSLAGGAIGYASSKIFVHKPSLLIEAIFAIVSTIAICWAMSVVVSISLKASVEFKSRKKLFPSSKRPSKLLKK